MILVLAASALLLTYCAGTVAPPVVSPRGDDRFLADPRLGFTAPPTEDVSKRIESAWRFFLSGDYVRARRPLAELRTLAPDYAPATLLEALIALREGNVNTAEQIVNRLRERYPGYTAAHVAAAEIAAAQKDTRRALEIYRSITGYGVTDRIAMLERTLFEELYSAAQTAPEDEAIRLLAEALLLNPGAAEARMLLVGKLIGQRQFDEARRFIEPLLATGADRPDVQQALAEIDAGRGRYQEAIVRYERLQRRSPDPRYQQRLEAIKEAWALANMPPQFQTAVESPAITRADFAILLYWRVASVRFAQNLSTPPIAIDIDVPGRDEIIRAIAIGLFEVDPVTRRVSPHRPVTTATLSRLAARVLVLRAAPCARGFTLDRVLEACGVADPLNTADPDALVTGRQALVLLEQIDRVLAR